ncbi:MAG: cation:proton antiporter [Bdellovibrionales bacterium]|nr:cation:proton antiporter [Bdellovibrionales bacterium]
MPLLTSLLILIIVARLFGQISQRLGQPTIVGEMLAGVFLGPSLLNVVHTTPALSGISELAVFLVVLSAGLEMNFKDIVGTLTGKGIVIAGLGFFIPLLAGIFVGVAFDMKILRTVFLALCISITALPVAIRILQNFGILRSQIARYSVATAIFNDVAALLVLGVILNLPVSGTPLDISWAIIFIGGKLLILASGILGFNWFLQIIIKKGIHIQRIPEKIIEVLGNEALFGIVVVFALFFGSFSELLGFHFVIGAFFGALLIDRQFFLISRYEELERTINSITGGFLAPVFFGYLGLEFNMGSVRSVWFVLVVLIVSVSSKVFAGWLGGRLLSLSKVESLGIGIILNGRGVMELVVAGIAYQRGLIEQGLFSTLVLMGVFTTIITPLMFKKWISPHLS